LPGGFIGVDVFFTISGFLITSILVRETNLTRGSVGRFWIRRVFRLAPAQMVMVLGVLVLSQVLRVEVPWRDYLFATTNTMNWARTFMLVGDTGSSAFGHTWSLSAEALFYGLWPVVLISFPSIMRHRTISAAAIIVLIVVLALWRCILFQENSSLASIYRLYDAPDTHSDSILAGCALALAGVDRLRALSAALWIPCAAVLLWIAFSFDVLSPFLYLGGFTLVAGTSAILVTAIATNAPGTRGFSGALLKWIGLRSYSAYLWHMPLLYIVPRFLPQDQVLTPIIMVVTVTIASMVSYSLIESPGRTIGYTFTRRSREKILT
jgi:peptidoglycan/LPS O-acetylase OafA/YrhL